MNCCPARPPAAHEGRRVKQAQACVVVGRHDARRARRRLEDLDAIGDAVLRDGDARAAGPHGARLRPAAGQRGCTAWRTHSRGSAAPPECGPRPVFQVCDRELAVHATSRHEVPAHAARGDPHATGVPRVLGRAREVQHLGSRTDVQRGRQPGGLTPRMRSTACAAHSACVCAPWLPCVPRRSSA